MDNLYTLKNFKPSNVFLLFAVFFIIAVFSFNSCSKDVDDDTPAAITTLLKSIKSENPNCGCSPFVSEYIWENKTVYVHGYNSPVCNWFPVYYDSTGTTFAMEPGYTFDNFLEESSFIKTLWHCQEN